MTETPGKPRRRRRWLIALSVALSTIAAVVLGAWLARVPIAEWAAFRVAEARGLALTNFDVEEIDFSGLVARDLRVGADDAIQAQEIRLRYSVASLRDGWVEEAVIDGLVVSVVLDESGVAVPGLPPPDEASPDEESSDRTVFPPIQRIMIQNATIEAATTLGSTRTTLSGTVDAAPNGERTIDANFTTTEDRGEVVGRLTATVAPDGALDGVVTIQDGSLRLDRGAISGLAGEVTFGGTPEKLDRARARLSYSSLDVAARAFEPGRLDLDLSDEQLAAKAALVWPGGRTTLDIRVDRRTEPMSARFDARGDVDIAALGERLPLDAVATGRVGFDLSGTVADITRLSDLSEFAPRQWLGVALFEGQVDLDLTDVSVPGIATASSLSGPLYLLSTEEAALIEVSDELVISNIVPADEMLARLPDPLRPALSTVGALHLTDASGVPPTLLLTLDAEGVAVQSISGLEIDTRKIRGSGELSAHTQFDNAGKIESLEIDELNVRAALADVAGFKGDAALSLNDIVGTLEAFDGNLALDLSGQGQLGGQVSFKDSSLHLKAALRRDGNRIALRPTSGTVTIGEA
jgi:hypothetical protein